MGWDPGYLSSDGSYSAAVREVYGCGTLMPEKELAVSGYKRRFLFIFCSSVFHDTDRVFLFVVHPRALFRADVRPRASER